jgi:membrane fusion protein (multidrug efflux system)
MFALMATDSMWLEANIKETDLTHVRPGQKATLVIDTYPDHELQAVVSGISPAAGSEYAVLPAQNATGNWVKITQRVPVRLELTGDMHGVPLRAGMSANVSIDTGRKRGLPFGG